MLSWCNLLGMPPLESHDVGSVGRSAFGGSITSVNGFRISALVGNASMYSFPPPPPPARPRGTARPPAPTTNMPAPPALSLSMSRRDIRILSSRSMTSPWVFTCGSATVGVTALGNGGGAAPQLECVPAVGTRSVGEYVQFARVVPAGHRGKEWSGVQRPAKRCHPDHLSVRVCVCRRTHRVSDVRWIARACNKNVVRVTEIRPLLAG